MEGELNKDEREIRDLVERLTRASEAGDVAAVVALMTEDAVFMVPGREPFGKQAFETAARGAGGAKMAASNTIVELRVIGEWAFARSRIDLTMTQAGEPAVRRYGYVLSLFRKDADGMWKLARDANLLTVREPD